MKTLSNLWAWSQERFPPSQGFFVAVLFTTGVLYGRYLSSAETLVLGWGDVAGFFACWAIFLMLRVFDEHKDYDEDLHNHPHRVLQSGRITLAHLKVLGLVAIVGQGAYCFWFDGGVGWVSLYWLVLLGWSLLMTVEFFIPRWLNAHLVVYGASHLLIMPIIMLWLMQIGAAGERLTAPAWWLAGIAFFAGCTYELTRKAWGAEEERDTIGSYARVFGTTGVAVAISIVLAVAAVASIGMVRNIIGSTAGWDWVMAPLAGWILVVLSVSRYAQDPTVKARKANEAVVSLGLLATYATPLVALIAQRGLSWQ
jgi:4-hydroxybenzoate polyprenyltransferase